MKKLLLALAMLSALGTGAFAKGQWAIGGALGSPTLVANVLMPIGPVSIDLDIGWSFWSLDSGSAFFTAVDFLLWEPEIATNLNFFIGVGPRLGFWAYGGNQWGNNGGGGFFIGPRVPIGIDWQPIEHLSLFAKIAPGVSFGFAHDFYAAFSFDFGFGARYVF